MNNVNKNRIQKGFLAILIMIMVILSMNLSAFNVRNVLASPLGVPADVGSISGNTINAGAQIRVVGKYHLILVEDGNVPISNVQEMKKFAVVKYNAKENCTYIKTKANKKAMAVDGSYRIHLVDDEGNAFFLNIEIIQQMSKVWKNRNVFYSLENEYNDFNMAITSGKAKTVKLITIKNTESTIKDIRWYCGKVALSDDGNEYKDTKGNVIFYYRIDRENNSITVAPPYGSKKAIKVTADANGKKYTASFKVKMASGFVSDNSVKTELESELDLSEPEILEEFLITDAPISIEEEI